MSDNYVTLERIRPDAPHLAADAAIDCTAPLPPTVWSPPVKNLEQIDFDRVRLVAYKITRNFSTCDDIAQTVYAKLLEFSPAQRESITCLQAYAFQTAKNEALNVRRAQHRNASLSEVGELAGHSPDPADSVCTADEAYRSLAKLPKHLREPFILCKVYDYDAGETAAALGITVEAVWKRVQRAFELLRKEPFRARGSRLRSFLQRTSL